MPDTIPIKGRKSLVIVLLLILSVSGLFAGSMWLNREKPTDLKFDAPGFCPHCDVVWGGAAYRFMNRSGWRISFVEVELVGSPGSYTAFRILRTLFGQEPSNVTLEFSDLTSLNKEETPQQTLNNKFSSPLLIKDLTWAPYQGGATAETSDVLKEIIKKQGSKPIRAYMLYTHTVYAPKWDMMEQGICDLVLHSENKVYSLGPVNNDFTIWVPSQRFPDSISFEKQMIKQLEEGRVSNAPLNRVQRGVLPGTWVKIPE